MSQKTSVIILAAGLGTRMKSKHAKVLHKAGGLSLIENVVESALQVAQPEHIVAVVGHQAERVRSAIEHRGIHFQLQTEQKGTGHAVLVCMDQPGLSEGLILVIYGDCPLLRAETFKRLIAAHQGSGAAVTMITSYLADPTGYGRILRNQQGNVAAIVEEKACTPEQKQITEINPGIYCFEASKLWPRLSALEPNPASGEIYLTDVIESLVSDGLRIQPFPVPDFTELMGINNRVELAQADRILRDHKNRELMLGGVTIQQPETVTIDRHVQVGQDTIIGPHVQLLGSTVIGPDCTIGASCVIENSTLAEDITVAPMTSIQDSQIGAGAALGPFARLRMNAVVEPEAHVGNFVELKKTRLGRGAKANHFAYLGDAQVGSKVNVGAGTITCNYDGQRKHPTIIGDGAFIGSNSTLVAPLEIGSGSYVAAGSVITDPVPQDALALGRSRQVVKEGWAQRRREVAKRKDG